jgi:beta-lactamase regulating signal transducer with metallopeptidase domain
MRDFLLALLIKATVLLGAAGLLAVAWRNSAAARRHLVWALALGGVLVLPIVQWLGPIWPVLPRVATVRVLPPAPPPPPSTTVSPVHPLAPPLDEVRAPSRREATTPPGITPPVVGTNGPRLTGWIIGMWLAGVVLVLGSFAVAWWRIGRLATRSREVTMGAWRDLFDRLQAELGLRRRVTLRTIPGPAMPMTWGVRHPVVLLPADAESWSERRRRDVLLHELAHVERRDCLTQLLAVLSCAVYWFHPLVWLAAGRLRVERERACDDRVLTAGAVPSEYAEHLLEIARTLRAGAATALAGLAMARPSHLATRLLDVLEPSRRRDALTRRLGWTAGVGALLVVGVVAALRPASARAADPTPTIADATVPPGADRAAAIVPAVAARRLRVPQSYDSADCQLRPPKIKNWQSVEQHDNDLLVRSIIGRCIIELRADAKFKFTTDFTDIASVEGGGLVVIEQRGGDVDRRVEIRGSDASERRWFVANDARPYDDSARAWLAATLTDLLRRTGYAAEERSRWILSTRGVEGTFQEISFLPSDYARRIYYQAMVADGHLDAANVARVVRQAGDEIDSDYDLAELLVSVAAKYPLTEPARTAFVTAANHIASDYDRHRVLAVVLAGRTLPDDLATAILGSAAGISSDYDLAEVLIVLIQKHPIGRGMSEAFFQAVNSIASDYDRRRVLATLLAQSRAPEPALVAAALRSVSGISSDYDRAEVLVQVAEQLALDDATRAPFFAAVDGIGSDYDHGRVLKAVMERPEVAALAVAQVIASARHIGSDYDCAEVLVTVAQHARLNDDLRRAFLEAARGIGSEYDRTRALAALGNAQLD